MKSLLQKQIGERLICQEGFVLQNIQSLSMKMMNNEELQQAWTSFTNEMFGNMKLSLLQETRGYFLYRTRLKVFRIFKIFKNQVLGKLWDHLII